MLQDADSNAEHVMSSTKLMQSQQTPCSSPSLLGSRLPATAAVTGRQPAHVRRNKQVSNCF